MLIRLLCASVLLPLASAADSAFCDRVAANHGCCPACGYTWDEDKGSCVTSQPARSAYCKELLEPKHSGCCEYCHNKWSASEGKCVKADDVRSELIEEPDNLEYGPNTTDPIAVARWMAKTLTWGVLSTISTRKDGTAVGSAFGNPNSFADVDGVPYLYAADMDASMVDLFHGEGARQRASLALSEASLMDKDGKPLIAACEIGAGQYGDPENPPCARLVLTGKVVKLNTTDPEDKEAQAALFKRHPSFSKMPAGHDFFVAKFELDGIWLISAYGGAKIIKPDDYFKGSSQRYRSGIVPPAREERRVVPTPPSHRRALSSANTARGLVKDLTWGVLSTVSTRADGTSVGDAFGNPYSFADVDGVVYLYASDMDASMIDLFGKQGSPRANLAVSDASRTGKHSFLWKEKCQIGTILGDPENPPCARLVLSGGMSKVTKDSDEEKSAMKALVARHPSFAHYPAGHDFYVAKLAIDGIWLIDFFGGAAVIDPADYFKASSDSSWIW